MTVDEKFSRRSCILGSLVVAVLFCALFPCASQAQENKLSSEKRTQIETAVSKSMASSHVPGVSVAVVIESSFSFLKTSQ